MKKYIKPELECCHASIGFIMFSVDAKRENDNDDGGSMSNSTIWDEETDGTPDPIWGE